MRRIFTREFKLKAVKLVRDRGVSVSQSARDLDLHENTLRKGVRQMAADPVRAFPGNGPLKAEPAEIAALRKEVAKLKADVQSPRCLAQWLLRLADASAQPACFEDEQITVAIRRSFLDSDRSYGARRVLLGVLDLYSWRAAGWSMSKDMTAQLVTDALVMAPGVAESPRR